MPELCPECGNTNLSTTILINAKVDEDSPTGLIYIHTKLCSKCKNDVEIKRDYFEPDIKHFKGCNCGVEE